MYPNARETLLDAAIHIAATQGPEKVTYRSVGAQAGLSHSLVRFYFGSREVLLTQAFERAARRDAADTGLLAEDVESFGAGLVRTITEEPDRQLIQYDFLLRAVRGGGPIEPVTELYDHYIGQISGTLANLGVEDPGHPLAALVFAALDGLVLQHSIYRSAERTERVLDELRSILMLVQSAARSADRAQDRTDQQVLR
ncbi:TetR family transcriptional regulator [Micromonospora sp. Llam0]|nr:TetR family transcriptional regulator [Micromonospora sp. Llam0]